MVATTDRLHTEPEAARILQVKEQTLAVWRSTKRYDLPFVKVGRSVRYRAEDLRRWIDERTVGRVAGE